RRARAFSALGRVCSTHQVCPSSVTGPGPLSSSPGKMNGSKGSKGIDVPRTDRRQSGAVAHSTKLNESFRPKSPVVHASMQKFSKARINRFRNWLLEACIGAGPIQDKIARIGNAALPTCLGRLDKVIHFARGHVMKVKARIRCSAFCQASMKL